MSEQALKTLEENVPDVVAGARLADTSPELTAFVDRVAGYLDKPESNPVPKFKFD